MKQPHIVIIGAGFAGMSAARTFRRHDVRVTLIDRNNYYTFQPLLYQVATALLEADDVARSVRASLRGQRNARFLQADVSGVDHDSKEVLLADGSRVAFDWLINCAGSRYNHFGVPGVPEHAFFLKTLTEAVNLRSHILSCFERASRDGAAAPPGLLEFVIVGGGPTGVELAGSLVELFGRVLPKDFPEVDTGAVRVHLVEAQDSILTAYPPRLRCYAANVLKKRGVQLHLDTQLAAVTAEGARTADGQQLASRTIVWAAGIRASSLAPAMDSPLGRGQRLELNADLSLPERPWAFAAGDIAGQLGDEGPAHPQVGQVAIQQGRFAARQILARLGRGRVRPEFRYSDRGNMAIIGRNAAIAELSPRLGGLRLTGFPGFIAWLFIHLLYLPGHRNRFGALVNWAIHYFTFDRHARLITEMVPGKGDCENRN